MPGMPSLSASDAARGRLAATLVALLALIAIACAVWQLERTAQGVSVRTDRVGTAPVTVFRPAGAATATATPAPVVLIAHGFAGSQQLMQPFALTLARNGFTSITFDLPGHGRNPAPMVGGLADPDASLRTLLASMAEMGAYARQLAGGENARYAVIGHSMASDIVVRHAQTRPEVQATVGVSLFAPSITASSPPDSPRNLLIVAGALEPEMMAKEALRAMAPVAGNTAALDTDYGRFDKGSARRATLAPGVEHIGVLYSGVTLSASLAWLQRAFGQPVNPRPFIDARGPWLGLLLLGIVALAWPLSRGLPRVRQPAVFERRRWWGWRGQAMLSFAPALLTPLLLWPVPGDFMPLLLGDYLLLHLALYGALTMAALWLCGDRPQALDPGRRGAAIVAVLLTSAFALLAVGVPIDRYVFNVQPTTNRLPFIAAMLAGTLPWLLADEWLGRGQQAARGAYIVAKGAFLLSLVVAIALNPYRLFFLALIVPAILLLFLIYGLLSRWVGQRTGHPAVAGIALAVTFACFIAVTFPRVA